MIKYKEKLGNALVVLEVETIEQLLQYLDHSRENKTDPQWIKYEIGDPVPNVSKVEIEWKDEDELRVEYGSPSLFDWESRGVPILRYRILEE